MNESHPEMYQNKIADLEHSLRNAEEGLNRAENEIYTLQASNRGIYLELEEALSNVDDLEATVTNLQEAFDEKLDQIIQLETLLGDFINENRDNNSYWEEFIKDVSYRNKLFQKKIKQFNNLM